MSDPIKHECGIAFLRLLKPLEYYREKYGTCFWGVNKLYLLMEKQHNRGQDGAGIATIKLDMKPGRKYINRIRSKEASPIKHVFDRVNERIATGLAANPEGAKNAEWVKDNVSFSGELLLGHLRYGTFGGNSISHCHPFLRVSNWKSRNLVLAGNFNLTNVKELFESLVELGQFPKDYSDSVTMLEKIGHFLDEENRRVVDKYLEQGLSYRDAYARVPAEIDIESMLKHACKHWDGGYAVCGMLGHGDAFITRDPSGIRPAFYYQNDEFFVATSERPVIQTVFNVPIDQIQEIKPGSAMIVKKNGDIRQVQIREALERRSCSFERIYFSRGGDRDIYNERKKLGELLVPGILEAVENDLENTVLSYIPNTAESSFYGLIAGFDKVLNEQKIKQIKELENLEDADRIREILSARVRAEKVAIKDAKLRTFITDDSSRDELVAHVYDVTYGTIKRGIDNLVVIDDSIVRGTTLKQSILKILDRLGPKRIVVVSSAPQIRYPDCYGIDMAKLNDFIAFRAAIELLKENDLSHIIDETYENCLKELQKPLNEIKNPVKAIYAPFSDQQVSDKCAQLLKPTTTQAEVKLIFQSLEGLHQACPGDSGDWYFSGNYPTPGGNRVVCRSFVNFIEGRNDRAY